MSDYASELPIRSQLPGQVLPDDVIVKIGDGTNPTTQFASVDTNGSLKSRIADASGNVIASQLLSTTYWLQAVSPSNGPTAPGTAASFSDLIGGEYSSTLPTLTNGQQSAIQVNNNGVLLTAPVYDLSPASQTITAQDLVSVSTPEFNGQNFVTGAPTAGSTASFAISAIETLRLEVTGTWTGTLAIEISQDSGTTWTATSLHQTGTAYNITTFTNNVIGSINVAACTNFRVRSTAAWTGTATIKVVESVNVNYLYVANPVKLVDAATNVQANIVAGSTAASVGNTAIVVAQSPNSPTPAGTNLIGGATVYVGSTPASITNPVPVSITSASPGTPIQAYLTQASLAAGSTATLTYTVPATHTFSLERIWSSASGKIKTVVQNNGTTIFVGFNSTANPNIDMTITAPPSIAAGVSVTVLITNEDKAAFDVYATVEGVQVS